MSTKNTNQSVSGNGGLVMVPSSNELYQRLIRWALMALLSVVFFSCIRAEFLYWNWKQFHEQGADQILWAFLFGLRFDISAILMVLSPWLLFSYLPSLTHGIRQFRTHRKVLIFALFVLIQLPFWLLNFIDIEFINFVGRRFTAGSLFIFREFKGGGTQSFVAPYWGWIILHFLQIYIYFFTAFKIFKFDFSNCRLPINWTATKIKNIFAYSGLILTSLILIVIGLRGGLQKKPLNFVNANLFVTPILNNLVLNSTFTVLKTIHKEVLPRDHFFGNSDEMKPFLNGSVAAPSLMQGHRSSQKQNVVFVILESFALEYMGEVNHQKGFTPFLDELARKSLFFTNAFANGRRSIEGIGAIYAGIPAMMDEPFISSEFSSNYFVGLGSVLGKAGYHTSFFHGAENGSMYFDTFMKSAGVEHYFGAREYPNPADNDGAWGIYDGPFLNFMAEKMKTFPQPFFAGVFTLSSHPPYKIPEQLRSQFPEGPIEIAASISYTDWALKSFFKEIETEPWFKNTLFVITADHTQINYLPEYDNVLGHYRVPLLFYSPGFQWPEVSTQQPAQHIDIFPTVLDILGIDPGSTIWLGRSLFVPGEKTVTNYLEPGYFLVSDKNFVIWNRAEEPQVYSLQDLKQKSPLKIPESTHLENRLKSSVQYFSQGLWDQKLYFPSR